MSSFPPPYPYFLGIIYDSEYFNQKISTGSGLSISEANARYLQKTTPDTATALETFNGGVQTTTLLASGNSTFNSAVTVLDNSVTVKNAVFTPSSLVSLACSANAPQINLTNTTDSLNLYVSGGSNNIQLQPDKTLNIATTAANTTLNVGTGTRGAGVIHHYSDANNTIGAVHLNNGTSNSSNTNIHNGTSSGGNVNIASGASSSTAITIGNNSNTTTTLAGTTTINTLNTNSITGTLITSPITLYNTTTSGTIQIGQGQTSGQMDIAGSTSRTADVNIGRYTKGTISIGDQMTGPGTRAINIGNWAGTFGLYLRASGSISIGDIGSASINIGSTTSTTTIYNPLTLSYSSSYPITSKTQIGYSESPAVNWSTSAFTVISYSSILPPGNYTMSFSITVQGAYVGNFIYLGSNIYSAALDTYRTSFIGSAFPYTICSGSYTFCNLVSRDISLINYSANSQTLQNGYFNIVRLS